MNAIEKYDILDLTKFISSLMVVAIHTDLFPMVLYPWLRMAVPLFFMISSFLLFKKINISKKEERINILKKYIFRIAKLYLFWIIVLMPVTIWYRSDWFVNGFWFALKSIVLGILFYGTIPVSWYFSASIIGTLIVYYLTEKIKENRIVLLILFSFCGLLCCFSSTYSKLFPDNKLFLIISNLELYLTFLVSLLYIYIGKLFADGKMNFISHKKYGYLSLLFGLLLFFEWRWFYSKTGLYLNDILLCIMPFSICVFCFIKNIKIKLACSKFIRQFSSFLYPTHKIGLIFYSHFINKINLNLDISKILIFILTVLTLLLCFVIVKKLENKKYFKFLSNSY